MKEFWKNAILLLAVLGLMELTAFVAAQVLIKQNLMLADLEGDGYADYLARRDPITGWPPPDSFGTNEYDVSGARVSARFPDSGERSCVAVFGDSFTWGEEVAPEFAYGDVLADLLGCRVANYGVGGFGTDQAYLRYKERISNPAPVVILSHYSENIIRNVNQLRDLMAPVTRFGFKPRFRVSETGALEMVPLPTLTQDEYLRVPGEPLKFLPFEYFAPNSGGGLPLARFPYLFSVAKVASHYRVRARLRGRPSYEEFYDSAHPSNALAVTTGILGAFVQTAHERRQVPIVVVLPDVKDLESLQSGNGLPFEPLIRSLNAAGIEVPPLTEQLLERLDGEPPCTLYGGCNPSRGHFNQRGYRLVAEVLFEWLRARGLANGPPAA